MIIPKKFLKKLAISTIFGLAVAPLANAMILFQNDTFEAIPSASILVNSDDQNSGNIAIQFGASLAETIQWDETNGWFEFSNNVSLGGSQLLNARVENAAALPGGGSGLGLGGTGRMVQLTTADSTAPGCTSSTCYPGTYVWNGTAWDTIAGGTPPPPEFDTIAFIDSGASAGSLSTTLGIGSAGTNRIVAVFAMSEANAGSDITGVTVDSNGCTEVAMAFNQNGLGNRTELWVCDESDLGSSNGTVTATISGSGITAGNWAVHAISFEGVDQNGANDSGLDQTSVSSTTTTVTGIDVPENGLVIMASCNGTQGLTASNWTSPLSEETNADPSSADGIAGYGIESSAQTNKTYSLTWSSAPNRSSGVAASWGPAAL